MYKRKCIPALNMTERYIFYPNDILVVVPLNYDLVDSFFDITHMRGDESEKFK